MDRALRSKMTIVTMFAALVLAGLPASAQTLDLPAPDLAEFRQCLARATSNVTARTCDQPIFEACERRSDQPGTTISISECTTVQSNAWDRALNDIWPATLNQQDPQARAKLRSAQRLWIGLRTADCAAVYEANITGTIRGPASATCYRNITRDRYFWLKGFPIY
jgi:uncharacterized protein YecT (DUF1311 family)